MQYFEGLNLWIGSAKSDNQVKAAAEKVNIMLAILDKKFTYKDTVLIQTLYMYTKDSS